MPTPILMPALSPTMTEGTLAKWLKAEGDDVVSGDVLAEIETDKATMEVEAVDEGTLGRILIAEGTEEVAVNTPIAVLLDEGEGSDALSGFDAGGPPALAVPAPATPPPVAAPPPAAAAPAPAPATPAPAALAPAAAAPPGARIFASPLARRLALQGGIDLAAVAGSGPHGRIVKADIEAFVAGAAPAVAAAPAAAEPAFAPPVAASPFEPPFVVEKASTMRKTIARRLAQSKATVPHFYLTVDIELDALLALRKQLNDKADGAYKLSVNDMVLKAVAVALKRVPKANASWSDEGIKYYQQADISVAVAIDGGLITPIIRDAGGKGLETISAEMKALAVKARDGKLQPEEYQGGTFSVSNLGMFGIKDFAAVINPPEGCILAVGAGAQRPVVKDGALAVATVMSVTLSVDHRVVDGAIGAEFLAAFKGLLQDPVTMLL